MGGRLSLLALWLEASSLGGASRVVRAEDCNANGVPDERDVRAEPRLGGRTGILTSTGTPMALLCEDLDGDGALDVAVANESSRISVSYGSGAGELREESIARSGIVRKIHVVVAARIDRDRLLDLLTLDDSAGEISIIIQRDGREFADAVIIPAGRAPTSMAAGDLDGDGDGDIAVTTRFSVSILWNDDGKWAEPEAMENGSGPQAIVAADLDGDGRVDLATANSLPANIPDNVSVLLQREGRSFSTRNFASGKTPVAIAAGDLDADGDIDIATTNSEPHSLTVLLNRGDGSLEPPKHSALGGIAGRWLSLTDVDGDLRLDALLTVFDPVFLGPAPSTIFRGTGDGRFEPWLGSDQDLGTLAAAGDLDADGDADLVVSGPSAILSVVRNEGSGSFANEGTLELLGEWSVSKPAMVDADDDGDTDAIAIVAGPLSAALVAVLRNDGQGGLSLEPVDPAVVSWPLSLVSIDLEPDGDPDACVFVRKFPGKAVALLRNDGTGRLEAAGELPAMETPTDALGGDLDGDGLEDLAVLHYMQGTIDLYWNDGSGSLSESIEVAVPKGLGGMVAADLDGDGDKDLGFGDAARQRVTVLENQGGRRFTPASGIDNGGGALSLASADFDGDGGDDLLFASVLLGKVDASLVILLQLPGGGFSDAIRIPFPDFAAALLAADLDGDKDLDAAGLIGGAVVTAINDGSSGFRRGPVYDPSTGALSLSAADLDGDGLPEVIASGGRGLGVLQNRSRPAVSEDADRDGVPDDCEAPPFHRGDPTGDGRIEVSDVVGLLEYLFRHGPPPTCADAGDTDDDGRLGVGDPIFLLLFLFAGGAPPPVPGPAPAACGRDPVSSSGSDGLGCGAYAGC
jgi:hypothetical protein